MRRVGEGCGGMWDLIVLVPAHCLSFYFSRHHDQGMETEVVQIARSQCIFWLIKDDSTKQELESGQGWISLAKLPRAAEDSTRW